MTAARACRRLADHVGRRAEWYLVPLFFVALVGWLNRTIWTEGTAGVGWDLIESYWPDLAFVANEFSRGNFPLWNPYERGGVPAHADPQPALFYPVQWLFAAWGVWQGETSWTLIQVKEHLHQVVIGVLLHLFLRTHRLPWQAALVGGVTMVLSGPWFVNRSNNYLHAITWIPLVWIAIDALLIRTNFRRACALATALYLPATAGHPAGYFYTLLLAGSYALFRGLPWLLARAWHPDQTMRAERHRDIARLARALLVTGGLVMLTQLIVVVPVRDIVALSPRASRTVAFALSGECGARDLVRSMCVPTGRWFGTTCSYVALVLSVCAAVCGDGRRRALALFCLVFGGLFFVLSLGGQTPVLEWLVVHLPGFGLFRISCRYLLLYAILISVAAATGVAVLLEARNRPGARVVRIALVTSCMAAIVTALVRWDPTVARDAAFPLRPWLTVTLSASAIWAIVLLPRRWAFRIAAVLPLLIYFDNAEFFRRDMWYHPRPDNLEDRAKVAQLPALDRYRIYDEFLLEQRAGSRLSLREFRGYTSGDPLVRTDYHTVLQAAFSSSLQVMAEYNVRYIFFGPHSLKGWGRKNMPDEPHRMAPGHFRKVAPVIYEALHPAPWAAWYAELRQAPAARIPTLLGAARDTQGVRRFAYIAEGELERTGLRHAATPLLRSDAQLPAPPGVPAQVTHFATETVEVEVDAPAEGVVVLNEAMFPGWRVLVDGKPGTPLSVDLFLRGVLVSAGRHHIRWEYSPPWWGLLVACWCAGMAVFIVTALTALRRRSPPSRVVDVSTMEASP